MLLSNNQTEQILAFLDVLASPPSLPFLTTLLAAYTEHVPWESASRLVRRAQHADNEACVNWPATFWQQAETHGLGGTCFESNLAFYALLEQLGFELYLTINNMGEQVGCHTALIVRLDGEKWLVDVGLPLFVPLPVEPGQATRAASTVFSYQVVPAGNDVYQILRAPHPAPNAFTLIDRPVPLATYQQAVIADYGPDGYFLNRVVINTRQGQTIHRFNSQTTPYTWEAFRTGHHTPLDPGPDPATTVSRVTGVDAETIRQALAIVQAMN
ncbi:MAG: arylamine N-acetyltransferase [Ardenticatenales bacterium]|nr:arylamine N-acetyltransferase [Ardenticatenales bacterium]